MQAHKYQVQTPFADGKGGEVSEIEIKPVTTQMYLRIGELMRSEVRTNGNVETVFVSTDMDALRAYMVACTGLSELVLINMSMADTQQVKAIIEGFFHGSPTES